MDTATLTQVVAPHIVAIVGLISIMVGFALGRIDPRGPRNGLQALARRAGARLRAIARRCVTVPRAARPCA